MSLLYTVVFATRCRSNHHRIAVDALRHLKSPNAEAWATLLLHHHKDYLDGAKAPDDVFKDFKNHVLHVREGEWGGAIESCEEWRRRTVRALKEKDWRQAAWSAGVMSHYYADPIQPFHTHQSEEEGVIHRAVEWSFSKSYKTFQAILEARGGYPEIAVPGGENWLAEMVRAGARASNPHYETVIDHYDFAKGVKDPPAGLDNAVREIVAGLIGHAVVGLARILDRTFAEAAIAPPKIDGALQAFFLACETPIQAVLKLVDDVKARAEVAAQYEEFRRTGKVRETLGEDDKIVRKLHAAEVLKTPLSSLDAKWPREIGARFGAPVATPAPAAKPAKGAKAQPQPQTPPPAVVQAASTPGALDPNAPVVDAPSIGPKTGKRLEAIGVKTVADLIAIAPEVAQAQLRARHISVAVVRDWQAQAALACAVPGLRSREVQALVACDVRDAAGLAQSDVAELTEGVARWGLSEDGARAWGSAPAPSEEDVAAWIARAKDGEESASRKKNAA